MHRVALALLVGAAAACASLGEAFAPASRPWPVPKEGPLRRDKGLLRVYGASLKNLADAETDARRNLELWLWRLELGDDVGERRRLIESVLGSPEAKPIPSPLIEVGFSSLIELDLRQLQKKLGTHYD